MNNKLMIALMGAAAVLGVSLLQQILEEHQRKIRMLDKMISSLDSQVNPPLQEQEPPIHLVDKEAE